MAEFPSWREMVTRWRKEYPQSQKFEKGSYDPTKIKCSPRKCERCKSTRNVTRHHKGHEYYLALVAPHFYAERYIQFREEDVVYLCDNCHALIHEVYLPIMFEFRAYINGCLDYITVDGRFLWIHKPQYKVLESFRKRWVSLCNRWLGKKLKRYKKRGKKKKVTKRSK